MTFLELQRQIQQTKKARKGVKNRHDYFKNTTLDEEMALEKIYKKALKAANEVLKHYAETGEYNPEEKMKIIWAEEVKTKSNKTENLKSEIETLKKELAEFKEKFRRGGRKSYNDTTANEVKLARANGETWRGLATRLGISTTTAQKLLRK